MGGFCPFYGHFSASVLSDVEAQGGGDARSLTPRCSATLAPLPTDGYGQAFASSPLYAPAPPPGSVRFVSLILV